MLERAEVEEIYLPRLNRMLNAPPEKTTGPIRQLLHDRRVGIEPLIGHLKQNGQMGRSRIKSDETTKSAGYCAVLGFNLRQLTCHVAGEARLKYEEIEVVAVIDGLIELKTAIPQC